MVWWGYKAMGAGMKGGMRVGTAAGNRTASNLSLAWASRGARRGYLAPGDPTPPPTSPTGYLDYRGTARWNEARNLVECDFPVGAFIDLKKARFRGPMSLPDSLLNRHAIVVGPAGSGKTYGVLIPWMYAALQCGWSVLSLDVKGDMTDELLRYKQEVSRGPLGVRVVRWDFTAPQKSVAWDWMAELTDDARIDAAVIAFLGREEKGNRADPFFYQRDYRTLRGLLRFARAVAPKLRTPAQLADALEDQMGLIDVVNRHLTAPGAADLRPLLQEAPTEYARSISSVVNILAGLDTQGVGEVMSPKPGKRAFQLDHTLDEHTCVIVGAPKKGGRISETLASLFINQLQQRLYERFSQNRRPVLLVIDEAAQLADRVDIAELMEVARGANVGVVVALQDVAKFRDEGDRSSIVTNAATFMMLPGGSAEGVKTFGQRLGQRTERELGMSTGGPQSGMFGNLPTEQIQHKVVPVLGESEIMQPPVGVRPAIVHINAGEMGITPKPFLVELSRG